MFKHYEIKAAYVLKMNLRKNEDVIYRFKMVSCDIGKNAVIIQESPGTKGNLLLTNPSRADPKRVIDESALLVADLVNKWTPVVSSISYRFLAGNIVGMTEDL